MGMSTTMTPSIQSEILFSYLDYGQSTRIGKLTVAAAIVLEMITDRSRGVHHVSETRN